MTDTLPAVDFDHNSPEFAQDVRGEWRRLRQSCPVAWSRHHGGFWVLTRYEDVVRAALDDAVFSSARHPADSGVSAITIPQKPGNLQPPIEMDPPESTRIRRFMNGLFTRSATEETLVPLMREVIDYCIDQVCERGTCDLVEDVAGAASSLFTLVWLGLPTDDWRRFAKLQHDATAYAQHTAEFQAAVADYTWQFEIISRTIAARRAEPRDDVVSYFLAQTVNGEPVDEDLVAKMTGLLIAGGVHTMTSLAGQSLAYLDDRPELRERLRTDDALLEQAVEEFLRYFSPVPGLARTIMADVQVGGHTLRAGDRCLLGWGSANHDPDAFDDPARIDLERRPNRHIAFGIGSHRCVGAHIGRRGPALMIRRVLERLGDFRIDTAAARLNPVQGLNSGWAALPCRFTPSMRVGAALPTR